jgi:hypothetical protein
MFFEEILKIDNKYYLSGWKLFIELNETKNNIEKPEFYNWDDIYDDEFKCDLYYYIKLDFEGNFNNIIKLVENHLIENIKYKKGYNYQNNKLTLEWWVLEDLVQCDNCGHIWDGFAQCSCYLDY